MFSARQLLVLAMMGTASAHMQMQFPAPFRSNFNQFAEKGTDAASNMNAPLQADGSDFPCKGYQADLGTSAGQPTASFAVGGQGNITIADGGAPHGGGSCQISLSMDGAKTFTVVQSIIGGCPASGASYDFTIPDDVPAGDAVLAWTWHNNIGNREMYMNCAAVTLTGGSAKRSPDTKRAAAFSSRPGIYIANVGAAGDGCTTTGTDNKDIIYPDAGPDVQDTSSNSVAPPCGVTQGKGAVTASSSSNSDSDSGFGASSVGSSSGDSDSGSEAAPSSVSSSAAPQITDQGGVFAANSNPQTTLSTKTSTTYVTTTSTRSDAPASTPASAPASTAATGDNTPGTACSPEGAYACLSGGTSFQRCASGLWSVVQPMAAGTTCSTSEESSTNLKLVALDGAQKRHLHRHRRSHL